MLREWWGNYVFIKGLIILIDKSEVGDDVSSSCYSFMLELISRGVSHDSAGVWYLKSSRFEPQIAKSPWKGRYIDGIKTYWNDPLPKHSRYRVDGVVKSRGGGVGEKLRNVMRLIENALALMLTVGTVGCMHLELHSHKSYLF